jgi:protein-S-isoprenylcysteine O-methyltransferase Ste14
MARGRNGPPTGLRSTPVSWWRGRRGEWYLVSQSILIGTVVFGPRTFPGLPAWPASLARIAILAGAGCMLAGGCLLLASLLALGSNLTPLPYPREHGTLVQSGAFRLVRHPTYLAVILFAFGWAFLVRGWLTFLYAAVLLIFLDRKARREELWLVEKYPEYADYQRRVRRLIPFLY